MYSANLALPNLWPSLLLRAPSCIWCLPKPQKGSDFLSDPLLKMKVYRVSRGTPNNNTVWSIGPANPNSKSQMEAPAILNQTETQSKSHKEKEAPAIANKRKNSKGNRSNTESNGNSKEKSQKEAPALLNQMETQKKSIK